VPEAISDTGPILHLFEIGRLTDLSTVGPLLLPSLVVSELSSRGIGTDDLKREGMLEQEGASVVGSVGLLIRAYTSGKMDRDRLERSMDALLNNSTLHLSRPFRTYIRKLIAELRESE
jgi:predicted nucleic acid-binding protein